MQEVEQLVKMVNQIAENFSFHDDAVDRITDHLQRFWAPSMQQKLIEFDRVEGADLKPAAREALKRLGEGEARLAVHPNCGTILAVSGLAAGGLAWMSMAGTKGKLSRRLRRLPLAVLMGMIGFQMAKPLGPKLQEQITTNADVSGLKIIEVVQHNVMGNTVHRVSTSFSR